MPTASTIRRWLMLPLHAAAVLGPAKSFRDNPVIGSPALNRRGLHVARRKLAARMGDFRRSRLAHCVSAEDQVALRRDGFIVKPDFLDPATFQAFHDEIMGLEAPAREALIGDTLTRLIPLDGPTLKRLPTVRAVLQGAAYRNLLDYVGSFKRRPNLYVQTVFSRFAEDAEPDVQSFFHGDTFHPTLKSWFYLQDVSEDAAPFAYVPGSHRHNRRRLAWERRMSITAHAAGDKLTAEGSLRISEAEIARLGYRPARKYAVAANTLVIADTSGIHRRSTTTQPSTRVAIWAYSRSNPFLPWTGGDPGALAPIRDAALRLYWAVTDRVKTTRSLGWRWVGLRSPLTPARPKPGE